MSKKRSKVVKPGGMLGLYSTSKLSAYVPSKRKSGVERRKKGKR